MNDSERTPSKEAKLKLKGFHKRQIFVNAIKNLFVKRKVDKPRKEMTGSGSGGRGEKYSSRTYRFESVRKYWSKHFGWSKIRGSQRFNKQQLPGKLILIDGKYFRIKK